GRIEIAAAVVDVNHFIERGEFAVMKEVGPQPDVAQTRRAKLADVVGIAGYLKAARVFCLGPHADIVKRVVAEQRPGVANITSRLIEDALPAHLLRRKLTNSRSTF